MEGERLNTGMQELTQEESLHLLGTMEYGRIGIVVAGRPEIFPINYAIDDEVCVVFRTVAGMKLASALNRHVVFEVDQVDPVLKAGWSVVVHGVAYQSATVHPGQSSLASWLPDRPYTVRISRESITGRVVGPWPAELSPR
jgi:uncharacterized protein